MLQVASLTGCKDPMKLHNACGLTFHKNLESGVIFKVLIALQNKVLMSCLHSEAQSLKRQQSGVLRAETLRDK